MKTESWKFGYVRDNLIIVFNNPVYSFPIFGGHFLEDVTISIENITLRIIGTKIIYDYYLHKTPENEWENEPEEKEIFTKKSGLFKKQEMKYLKGWVETKKRESFDMEFGGNWILERKS